MLDYVHHRHGSKSPEKAADSGVMLRLLQDRFYTCGPPRLLSHPVLQGWPSTEAWARLSVALLPCKGEEGDGSS